MIFCKFSFLHKNSIPLKHKEQKYLVILYIFVDLTLYLQKTIGIYYCIFSKICYNVYNTFYKELML